MIEKLAKPDKGRKYVATGKHEKLNAFYVPDLQYTIIGKLIIYRLKHDRDLKMVITGSGKSTGTGKTTLAIHFARFVNQVRNYLFNQNTEWNSREYSFMNVWEYLKRYDEANPGDPLITDELEHMFDNRRSMSNQNKYGTEAWSVLRYKNVVTIGTAPGLSDVDKRIPEGADVWINVIHAGKANVYYLTVNDFTGEPIYKRLRMGRFRESIFWNPIESDDDYQWLKEQKEELGVPGLDKDPNSEEKQKTQNQFEKDLRNSYVKKTLLFLDDKGIMERFTQADIAEMCEVSQPQVSKLKKEMESDGVL